MFVGKVDACNTCVVGVDCGFLGKFPFFCVVTAVAVRLQITDPYGLPIFFFVLLFSIYSPAIPIPLCHFPHPPTPTRTISFLSLLSKTIIIIDPSHPLLTLVASFQIILFPHCVLLRAVRPCSLSSSYLLCLPFHSLALLPLRVLSGHNCWLPYALVSLPQS